MTGGMWFAAGLVIGAAWMVIGVLVMAWWNERRGKR